MNKIIGLILVLMCQQSLAEILTKNCSTGYGPSESNITALLDDEQNNQILIIGYENAGLFYEMRLTGCNDLHTEDGFIMCGDETVGGLSPTYLVINDPNFNGYRALVRFEESLYKVTGSCRKADKEPLTLHILN